MSHFPLRRLIFIALTTLAIAKKNDHQNIEKVEIELDVFRGDAKITYNDEWKSEAEVLYAQKKKIVAYKDIENGWCLLEKIEQRGLANGEDYSRQFKIINTPLDKDKLEKLAGKKILTFCAKRTSIVLKPYSRGGRRGRSKREERVKREVQPLRGNESQISHQEASRKLLEDLTNAQSLGSSRTSHGKDLKRNADGKTENSREHYPSSSAKVEHPPGIDYHTHVRNNIFPGSHAVHPIDITSSVTITTGSMHKIWSYPPSSGGYHNTTAISHPSETSNLPHSSHHNTSRDVSLHGVQHSLSHHHPYTSSLAQNQGYYSPSANSKSQQGPAIYPPSSTSKTQTPVNYPPSSVSKNHQVPTYYPPSSTSKTQGPAHYPPSSTSKTQGPAHYPPSSTSKTQGPAHYPPSSTSKTQGPAHYPPSSTSKTQGPAHYPPSSTSKTQGPAHYPPSSTSKTQGPAHYPPSSTSKTQGPAHYPPSSTSKTQGPAHYPPSATTKTQRPSEYFPPSSSTKAQPPSYYRPSAAAKYQPPVGHYPPSSSSKTEGPADYPPSATSKSHHIPAYYPPSSSSHPQHIPAYYPPSSSSKPQHGKTLYSLPSGRKSHHDHEHYPPSSSSKSHYLPSGSDKTHHNAEHYSPSSVSKHVHEQYPPSSTGKTHQLQQNITSGSPNGGGIHYSSIGAQFPSPTHYVPSGSQNVHHSAASHPEQTSYVFPSSTSKIHYQPQNGTHFQYNNLYSYGAVPGMYAPQFPPSSTSKLYSPQQFPSSESNANHLHKSENHGVHHRKYPHSFAQYPPSSTAKFHTKLDHSGGQTQHYPPSSTSKMHFPLSMHDPTAPVLEKPSAEGSRHEHGNYPTSSSAKEHPAVGDISHYPPSSASKAHYIPPSGHMYGGAQQGHVHPPLRSEPSSTPPSGSPPPVQIPQPPVSGHFHSSFHIHSFPGQYYPPSASVKQSHNIPHSQTQQPVAYYPSSTAKLHPVPNQNITKHLPPGYFPPSSTSKLQPSSIGHRHDFHSGLSTSSHVPYYPPSAHSKSTLNQGSHPYTQDHPHYTPPSWHHMRNESTVGMGKSLPPSSVGYTYYSQPQYPPSSSSKIHPNSSENTYPSPAMPSYPSGAQYHPIHSPYNVTISHHHQYQQPNIAPQPHGKPQNQQGPTKPCQGSLYSVTTRTIVTPNGVIQRPVSVKNSGDSPCGNARQGAAPYSIPCGSIIKNGHTVKVQSPCMSNHLNQRKSMRNVLLPGPALIPGKRTAEQSEFGSSGGAVITNVNESEAEVLAGIGYPVSHQQLSHLKENSTFEEVEDFEGGENQTKPEETGEKEKVEDVKEEGSAKSEEKEEDDEGDEEEVKEGDVLQPGDRILGKNGYTISDGFRGRVVSVSGQVGKTRTTKQEKKSNSAQFKYSSELGRYFKDDGEKRFSDCNGEVTFTCSEFLGSNGRAKICKPNPRRNPDGSPC